MTNVFRLEALFASNLQPSMSPDADEIDAAIDASLRDHGGERGCTEAMAVEYGEHPEAAPDRMRWVLSVIPAEG